MYTNFDYLKQDPQFNSFSDVAISAEKIILLDPEASIINSRRAMEFAVKWMYSVDKDLSVPYQNNLQSLMNAEEYRQIVGPDLWKRMDFIRRCGNNVAHGSKEDLRGCGKGAAASQTVCGYYRETVWQKTCGISYKWF